MLRVAVRVVALLALLAALAAATDSSSRQSGRRPRCDASNALGCVRYVGGSGWVELCPPAAPSNGTTAAADNDDDNDRTRAPTPRPPAPSGAAPTPAGRRQLLQSGGGGDGNRTSGGSRTPEPRTPRTPEPRRTYAPRTPEPPEAPRTPEEERRHRQEEERERTEERSDDGGDDTDSECVRIRPRKLEELDARGRKINSHRVKNLGRSMGAAPTLSNGTFPTACDLSNGVSTCATPAASAGVAAVGFQKVVLPVTTSWASFNLNIFLISHPGTLTFGSTTVNVAKGDFKFNLDFSSYTFAANGASVALEMTVKQKNNRRTELRRGRGNATSGTLEEAGLIQNFPQFLAIDGNNAPEWRNTTVNVETDGSATVLKYSFAGPFTQMAYDPFVSSAALAAQPAPDAPVEGGSATPAIVGGVVGAVALLALAGMLVAKKRKPAPAGRFQSAPVHAPAVPQQQKMLDPTDEL